MALAARRKLASAPPEDRAPPASLDHPKAQATPTHAGAPPEQLGGVPWAQWPASARPRDAGFSAVLHQAMRSCHDPWRASGPSCAERLHGALACLMGGRPRLNKSCWCAAAPCPPPVARGQGWGRGWG